jgi:hypothetical protein
MEKIAWLVPDQIKTVNECRRLMAPHRGGTARRNRRGNSQQMFLLPVAASRWICSGVDASSYRDQAPLPDQPPDLV